MSDHVRGTHAQACSSRMVRGAPVLSSYERSLIGGCRAETRHSFWWDRLTFFSEPTRNARSGAARRRSSVPALPYVAKRLTAVEGGALRFSFLREVVLSRASGRHPNGRRLVRLRPCRFERLARTRPAHRAGGARETPPPRNQAHSGEGAVYCAKVLRGHAAPECSDVASHGEK